MNDNTKRKDPQNKQQNIISTKSNKTYLQCMYRIDHDSQNQHCTACMHKLCSLI